ncbi:hypothetical protein BC351_28965 [Paenibacillus ferrarius]|uniref:DUF2357 domain-containing protein n=1 Tax=Paenibacillus ferrarius TaxID=1469647 RepID=A0A1V4HI11_9BACL|nr:nuclease domain-containing protein [Paenibacillus ferrarius]OPH56202.1 hypothetical protein BC351_28965 [Paenibacillus ferrarius]
MESPLTSNNQPLRFLDMMGEEIQRPMEWEPCLIEVLHELGTWETYVLKVHQEKIELSLRKIKGLTRLVGEFPRSGPGHYRILIYKGEEVQELRIKIFPSKISESSYCTLIEDLNHLLPINVTIALKNVGAFGGVKFNLPRTKTLQQELVLVQRAIHGVSEGNDKRIGLVSVLEHLSSAFHQLPIEKERLVEIERVRQPRPTVLLRAIASYSEMLSEITPIRIMDRVAEHSADTQENRLVYLYCHQVKLRLIRFLRTAQSIENFLIYEEGSALLIKLKRALHKATFMEQVRLPVTMNVQQSMIFLKNPFYRAALEGYLEFQRSPVIFMEDSRLSAPLENLPSLYQSWCAFQVYTALLNSGLEHGYSIKKQVLVSKRFGELVVKCWPDNEPTLEMFHLGSKTTIRFITEREYGTNQQGLFSISFMQRPDIAIEITRDGKTDIILFDPKYKLDSESIINVVNFINEETMIPQGKPKKVDIDKMHAYRDAIRNESGKIVVSFAAILYPGATVHYNAGLSAIQAYPGLSLTLMQTLRGIIDPRISPI